MSQPRRVRIVGGVPFPVAPEEDWQPPSEAGPVNFDGGAREPVPLVVSTDQVIGHFVRYGSPDARHEGGWQSIDIG